MIVGTALVELELPEGGTLKDKRRVVKSLLARTRQRFEVACAEVGRHDDLHRAALGVAAVGNDGGHVRIVLARVEQFLAGSPEAVLLEFRVELV